RRRDPGLGPRRHARRPRRGDRPRSASLRRRRRASGTLAGVRIGPYEVVRELGRGGMGIVYEVRGPEAARRLALKVIHGDGAAPDELERFRREARLLSRVQHPSVVAVHAVDRTQDGRDYLVTDLVEGESLGRTARQPLEPRRCAEVVRDLALAVEAVPPNRDP